MAKREKKTKKHTPKMILLSNEVQYLFQQFGGESDRACVILAAAVMDEHLTKMLKSKLVQIHTKDDQLFDGFNAPIGNFSTRIGIARRLGLISKKVCKSLDIIRKIRNDFSHDIFNCDFKNQSVRDRLSNLIKVIGPKVEATYKSFCRVAGFNKLFEGAMVGSFERQRFFVCAILILTALEIASEKVQAIDEVKTESLFESKLQESEPASPTKRAIRRRKKS
jgi:hypothetical protein